VKLLPKILVPKNSNTRPDDSLGRGPDIALSTGVFLFIGLAIDAASNTRPLFAITLVVLSLVGNFARMWFVYDDRMKLLERERHENSVSHQGRGSKAPMVKS